MNHLVLPAILVSACVPAAPSTAPAQQPWSATTAAGASCRDTLACYYQCQLTDSCIQRCDQQAAAAAPAHAVIACMAQNHCTDTACVSAACSAEVSACGDLATAPATAGAADRSDVSVQPPAGWTRSSNADAVMYDLTENVAGDAFYGQRFGRLAVFAPIALPGDLGDAFLAAWQQMIVAGGFKTQVVPIGLRRRLASGLGLIYDGGAMDLPQGGASNVNLYLVVAGDRAVPVLGMFNDQFLVDSTQKEPVVLAFLESIAIDGEAATSPALFTPDALVGTWSTRSAVVGSWVTSSGGYAGDASSATWDSYQLDRDGTYIEKFAAYMNGRASSTDQRGTWTLDDGVLTLRGHDRTEVRPVFAIGAGPGGGTALVLAAQYDGFSPVNVLQPRRMGNGEWFGKE